VQHRPKTNKRWNAAAFEQSQFFDHTGGGYLDHQIHAEAIGGLPALSAFGDATLANQPTALTCIAAFSEQVLQRIIQYGSRHADSV
jgi:hypothetical protein